MEGRGYGNQGGEEFGRFSCSFFYGKYGRPRVTQKGLRFPLTVQTDGRPGGGYGRLPVFRSYLHQNTKHEVKLL